MKQEHKGLSPSSFSLFQQCNRKYFFRKIAKHPIDSDVPPDWDAFNIGLSFHKALELTNHELQNFSLIELAGIIKEFNLDQEYHLPLVFAMLGKYKKLHILSGLKVLSTELQIETDFFFGIVDAVMQDVDGKWYIVDMKTASSYSPSLIPGLPNHPQLNLYTYHYPLIAKMLSLDDRNFGGCRYRLTTKSRIVRKISEPDGDYIGRLSKSVMSYEFKIPVASMQPAIVYQSLLKVFSFTTRPEMLESEFPQNLGSCMLYHKPCEFWSHCAKGRMFSEMQNLESLVSN